jgi:hypothetical protein
VSLPLCWLFAHGCFRLFGSWYVPSKDKNGTEIFRTDRFRFLHYDIVFYIMKPFLNFVKHKKLSVSVGFTTIFILFCTL